MKLTLVKGRDIFDNEVYVCGDGERMLEYGLDTPDNPWRTLYAHCVEKKLHTSNFSTWTDPEVGTWYFNGEPYFNEIPYSVRIVGEWRMNLLNRFRQRDIERFLRRAWHREFRK